MLNFTNQKQISTVTRQLLVGNISTSTTVLSNITCYFRPMSEKQSSDNGFQYGIAHNAIFELDIDIRENDKITIDSVVYTVKGVATFQRDNILDYKRALIVKPQL